MLTSARHEEILSLLKKERSATVAELAKKLYVSPATIRRDLTEMQKLGLIERSHGGAVFSESADEISIFVRMGENAKEKELAASNALKVIPEFKSVFLDSSSTVLAIAQRLDLKYKTVVTNNLQTALALSGVEGINLLILGGVVSPTGNSAVGSWANSLLLDFSFDLLLSSCAAVCERKAYETSLEQRDIKRTVFERSEKKILVCDHSKLARKGTYLYEPLSAFDTVVFDSLTPSERDSLGELPIHT